MDQHYHPLLLQRLRALFEAGDWEALKSYLTGLSNAHFRTAGYLIGERLMPQTSEDVFWEVMRELILWQPKAFTVTLGKAAQLRLQQGSLSFNDTGFKQLSEALATPKRTLDRQKLLLLWLPVISDPQKMESLLQDFGIDQPRRQVEFLLRTDNLAASFLLLRALRFEEHDREYLTTVCRQVMRRGDSLSFNLASLLRTYFDLPDIRGTFSLTLQHYELSRLDTDFEVFKRIVTKV
jgi:hypothetical protein